MGRMKKHQSGYYRKSVYLGNDENGKRLYREVYGKSHAEVDDKADELRRKLGRGVDTAVKQTFKLWADRLISDKKAEGVGASRLRSLSNHVDHLKPLWRYEIDKISSADIKDVLNKLADYHSVWWKELVAEPLSKKTLSQIKGTARVIFDKAIESRIMDYNPASNFRAPKGSGEAIREPLDETQQRWVNDTPHRAQRAAMIMLYAGLRRGELSALTWGDIDLTNATITVNKAVDLETGRLKNPKTFAGNRVVEIPTVLVSFLKNENHNEIFIVHKSNGERMTAQAWRTMWDSYIMDLNVKYGYDGKVNKHATRKKDKDGKVQGSVPIIIRVFTPHQLRHTFCSLMYFAGIDILTARDQMGHADIKTTLAIYTHLDKKHKRKSMTKLDDYLSENTGNILVTDFK